jgi:Zn-finger nucleic acid-binding protein
VDLERCQGCTGLFLDRGCLDKIAEPHEGDLEFSTLDQETFHHDDTHGVTECPACAGARMRKVEFIIHTGIILDYCVLCGGFWLDGKELDRVNKEVRELNEASDEAVAPAMLWFANFIWALPR